MGEDLFLVNICVQSLTSTDNEIFDENEIMYIQSVNTEKKLHKSRLFADAIFFWAVCFCCM